MNGTCENKQWRKIIAAVLVIALLALEFCLVRRLRAKENAAAARSVPAAAVSAAARPAYQSVTIYDVQSVNARLRAMTASETAVISGGPEGDWLRAVIEANAGLTYRGLQLDDIPILEVYEDDGRPKPLLIFLHGVTQSKESLLIALSEYARAGYHAVAMDAYGQGDRAEQGVMCDNWAAMLITVRDIDQMVEYYAGTENVRTEDFVLGGFSMGAVEAWAYAQLGTYRPAALLPMSGVCDLSAWREDARRRLYSSWLEEQGFFVRAVCRFQDPSYTREKYAAIESLNILDHLRDYSDIPVFCGMGTADHYFDSTAAEQVLSRLRQAGNDNAVFAAYEGGLHCLTGEMISDSIAFLQGLSGDRSLESA